MANSGIFLIDSSNNGYFKISTKKQAKDAIDYLENRIPYLQDRAGKIRTTWNHNNPDNKI